MKASSAKTSSGGEERSWTEVQALVADQQSDGGPLPEVFLLIGDEFLCRSAIVELTAALIPDSLRSLNLVELDAAAGPRQVADEIATRPMFSSGRKLVTVQPAEFLAPKKSAKGDPFAKARELWDAGRQKEAARRVLALAGRAGFALDGLAARRADEWKAAGFSIAGADLRLIAQVADLAQQEGLAIPESDARPLEALLTLGFPPGHHLLLAVEELDEKGALSRQLLEHGVRISRELPGQSAGFGKVETKDLAGLAREVLGPLGKSLDRDAERWLARSAAGSGSVRGLASELQKLAAHAGERPVVTLDDVRALVPEGDDGDLFAVSNALEAKDQAALVAAIDQELERGAVPLQILGSLAGAVRGLLGARAQLAALGLEKRLSFPEFEKKALPALQAAELKAGRKPGHPFRAFKRCEAALRYPLTNLADVLAELARADAGIKRGMDGRLWLLRIALKLGSR